MVKYDEGRRVFRLRRHSPGTGFGSRSGVRPACERGTIHRIKDLRDAVSAGACLAHRSKDPAKAHDAHRDHVEVSEKRKDHAGLCLPAVDARRADKDDRCEADVEEQLHQGTGNGHQRRRRSVA